jgi:hypothetical protein
MEGNNLMSFYNKIQKHYIAADHESHRDINVVYNPKSMVIVYEFNSSRNFFWTGKERNFSTGSTWSNSFADSEIYTDIDKAKKDLKLAKNSKPFYAAVFSSKIEVKPNLVKLYRNYVNKEIEVK